MTSVDKFTELQERILKVLIEHPLHRDEIAERLNVQSSQITRSLNLLHKGTFEFVRPLDKHVWQLTSQGRSLRFKSKNANNDVEVLRSKGEIQVNDEELCILSALASFTSAQVKPCKAELFLACDFEEDRRDKFYLMVDDLVERGYVLEHGENYGSAIYWYRYSIADANMFKNA